MKIDPIYTSKRNSILLKEKGFDVECPKVYDHTNSVVDAYYGSANNNRQESEYRGFMTAPEHWVVIEWLKQVHGIWIGASLNMNGKIRFVYVSYKLSEGECEMKTSAPSFEQFDTSYEATEAAIEYVLINLI